MEQAHIPAGSVVVGVDGSEHSDLAVRWAARRARAEHRRLVLLHATGPLPLMAPEWLGRHGPDPLEVRDQLRRRGRSVLASAARVAGSARGSGGEEDPEVVELVEVADPRAALLDASCSADTVVIGSRGNGPLRSLLLGSTSSAVVQAALCPVVVVAPEVAGFRHGVVVGADGTPGSVPVIEYAFRAASLMRCPLTVMHAYWDVAAGLTHGRRVSPDEGGVEDLRALLAESVAGIREKFPDVEVVTELSRGLVDECLEDAGATAELVVVGRHQRGALSRLLSRTVTAAVLEHARCPVAVVPEPDPDASGTIRPD